MDNHLNIVISGSRFTKEREKIIEAISEACKGEASIYDCNKDATSSSRQTKEGEIIEQINKCDWFVLVASTDWYGQYTFEEWKELVDSLDDNKEKVVTVFRCLNVAESVASQGHQDVDEYSFADFEAYLADHSKKQNFYVTYHYDTALSDLYAKTRHESLLVIERNYALRKMSISRASLQPAHVFANKERTAPENGYNEDAYIPRKSVDGLLESSPLLAVIQGLPAAGKTRAAYQYMKYSPMLPDDVRIVPVDWQNLGETLNALVRFDSWISEKAFDKANHSAYCFFFDEIDKTLLTEDNWSKFAEIYKIASKHGFKIIATTLPDEMARISKHPLWKNNLAAKSAVISIPNISDDSKEVRDEIRATFPNIHTDERADDTEYEYDLDYASLLSAPFDADDDAQDDYKPMAMHRREVIGDYIRGLVGYHERVEHELDSWLDNDANGRGLAQLFDIFVKACTVISSYRKYINHPPLGLVMKAMETALSGGISETDFNRLLAYLKRNNIIEAVSTSEYCVPAPDGTIRFNPGTYAYDNEEYSMLVPPDLVLSVRNDYLWDKIKEARGLLDYSKPSATEQAVVMFYDAFHHEAPISTIRRILTRSFADMIARRYKVPMRIAYKFIKPKLEAMAADHAAWDEHADMLNEMIGYLLHCSISIPEMSADISNFSRLSGGRFKITEIVACEILGFAVNASRPVKDQIHALLSDHGWAFDSEGRSLYYHRRMIELADSFEDAIEYAKRYVLGPGGELRAEHASASEETLRQNNLALLWCALAHHCKNSDNIGAAIDMIMPIGLVTKKMLKVLVKAFRDTKLSKPENIRLIRLCYDTIADDRVDKIGIDMALAAYYMISMSKSLENSYAAYDMLQPCFQDNVDLRARCVSKMLEAMLSFEYGLFIKLFFKNGSLDTQKWNLPQVARNIILKKFSIEIALSLLPDLFPGDSIDSTVDEKTLISLLKSNFNFNQLAKYKLNAEKKDNRFMVLQYLLEILALPQFRNMPYPQRAIAYMLNSVYTEEQENYVIDKYIKPNIESRIRREGARYTDAEFTNRVAQKLNDAINNLYVAAVRIRNPHNNNLDKVFKIFDNSYNDIIAKTQNANNTLAAAQDSSLVNHLFSKIFYVYDLPFESEGGDAKQYTIEEIDKIKSNLLQRLLKRASRTSPSYWDMLIKDEHFYNNYFCLYPEAAVAKGKDGRYRLSALIDQIPQDFVTEKLYSSILKGTAAIICKKEDSDLPLYDIEQEINLRCGGKFVWDIMAYKAVIRHRPDFMFACPHEDVDNNASKRAKRNGFYLAEGNSWQFIKKYISKKPLPYHMLDELFDNVVKAASCTDSMPEIGILSDLLTGQGVNSLYALAIIEEIYLKRGFGVSVTLWKMVTNKFKKRYDDDEYIREEIDELHRLESDYGHLIKNNAITNLNKVKILPMKEARNIAYKVLESDEYIPLQGYNVMLLNSQIFNGDIPMYIDTMLCYYDNFKILYDDGAPANKEFSNFMVKLSNMHADPRNAHMLETLSKEDLIDLCQAMRYGMGHFTDECREWFFSHVYKERWASLIEHIEDLTGNNMPDLKSICQ